MTSWLCGGCDVIIFTDKCPICKDTKARCPKCSEIVDISVWADCVTCSTPLEKITHALSPNSLEYFLLIRDREGFRGAFVDGKAISVDTNSPVLLSALLGGGLFWILCCGLSSQSFRTFICGLINSFLELGVKKENVRCRTFSLAAMMVHCLLNPKFYYLEDSFLALREKSYSWMIIDHVERTFHTDLARAKFLSKKCLIADMKRPFHRDIFKFYANDLQLPSLATAPSTSCQAKSVREQLEESKGEEEQLVAAVEEELVLLEEEEWPETQPGDGLDEADWEDDTDPQQVVVWEDSDRVRPVEEPLPPAVLHAVRSLKSKHDDLPTVRQRVVSFTMAKRKEDCPPMKLFARTLEAREMSDLVRLAIECAVPKTVIFGLLRECEVKYSLDVLQDVLLEVWYNSFYVSNVLPTSGMMGFEHIEFSRFYAVAAAKKSENSPAFLGICVSLCCGWLSPIPVRSRFACLHLVAPELLKQMTSYAVPLSERCSWFCQVLSPLMGSNEFLRAWLGHPDDDDGWLSDSLPAMLDGFFRGFWPEKGFRHGLSKKVGKALHQRRDRELPNYVKGVAARLREVLLIPELAKIVESYTDPAPRY